MRFPSALMQLIAPSSQGAILEPGDGELIVRAEHQPTVRSGMPLLSARAQLPPNAETGTVARNFAYVIAGAQVLESTKILTLGKGHWVVHASLVFAFGGTQAYNNYSRLIASKDSDSGVIIDLFDLPHLTSQPQWIGDDFEFSITEPWSVFLEHAATVAGDTLVARATIFATKFW